MLRFILLALITLIALPDPSKAKEASYLDIELPVMIGGENISLNKDDQNYSVSLSYEIVIEDTAQVYDFYDHYFREQGWKTFMEGHPFKKKWNGYGAHINMEGKAIFSTTAAWMPKDIPITGLVQLVLNDYQKGKFYGEVTVTLAPDMDQDAYMKFSELLGDPKNIFILQKAIGGDPFQLLEDTNIQNIPKEFEDEKVIKEYLNMKKKTLEQFKDFGEQYVLHTKPIDGRFSKKRFSNGFSTPPTSDTNEGQDGEGEDPLHRWRALQEERVERQMKAKEAEK
tara:strand:- start:95 stop:940 length:846 start_codon:yes stop_codon:yes gene_type:complete